MFLWPKRVLDDFLASFGTLPSAYDPPHILIVPARVLTVKSPEVIHFIVGDGLILRIGKRIEEHRDFVFHVVRGEQRKMAIQHVYGQIFAIYNKDVHTVREVR